MLYPFPNMMRGALIPFSQTYYTPGTFTPPRGCQQVVVEGCGSLGTNDQIYAVNFATLNGALATTPIDPTTRAPFDGSSLDQFRSSVNAYVSDVLNQGALYSVRDARIAGGAWILCWPTMTPVASDMPTQQFPPHPVPYSLSNPSYTAGLIGYSWDFKDIKIIGQLKPVITVLLGPGNSGGLSPYYAQPSQIGPYFYGPASYPGPNPAIPTWQGSGAANYGNVTKGMTSFPFIQDPSNPNNRYQVVYTTDPRPLIAVPQYTGEPPSLTYPSSGRYVQGAAGLDATAFSITFAGSVYTPGDGTIANLGTVTRPPVVKYTGLSVSQGDTYSIFVPAAPQFENATGSFIRISGLRYAR